jgi:hypothetical protein
LHNKCLLESTDWGGGSKEENKEVIMEMFHLLKQFLIKLLQPSYIAQNIGGLYKVLIEMLEQAPTFHFLMGCLGGVILVHHCVNMPWPSGQAPAVVRLLVFHRDVNLPSCFADCCSIWPRTNWHYSLAAFQMLAKQCDLDSDD